MVRAWELPAQGRARLRYGESMLHGGSPLLHCGSSLLHCGRPCFTMGALCFTVGAPCFSRGKLDFSPARESLDSKAALAAGFFAARPGVSVKRQSDGQTRTSRLRRECGDFPRLKPERIVRRLPLGLKAELPRINAGAPTELRRLRRCGGSHLIGNALRLHAWAMRTPLQNTGACRECRTHSHSSRLTKRIVPEGELYCKYFFSVSEKYPRQKSVARLAGAD